MFYKYTDEQLLVGDIIAFPDGSILVLQDKDSYTFPVNDWYYFETEEEAKNFFKIE